MINARLVAQISKVMGQFYPDTCTIEAMGIVSDGAGGKQRGVSSSTSGVACRFIRGSGSQERSDFALDAHDATYKISVPAATALDRGYRVIHNGRTYEVWELVDDFSNPVDKHALLKRIDQ